MAMADGTADQAAKDVALPHVRWRHATLVPQDEDAGAHMVGQNPYGGVIGLIIAVVLGREALDLLMIGAKTSVS